MAHKSKTAAWIYAHRRHDGDKCLYWPYGCDSNGYGRAMVRGFSTRLAHRVMCELAHGKPPFEAALAIHSCGRGHKGCVNPKHLRWGSAKENSNDKLAHGTKLIGEKIGRSVLSRYQVSEIRDLSDSGLSQRKIAAMYGIAAGTVQAILEGRTWRHVR